MRTEQAKNTIFESMRKFEQSSRFVRGWENTLNRYQCIGATPSVMRYCEARLRDSVELREDAINELKVYLTPVALADMTASKEMENL
jgi:hypothetical protein